ncbi:MAG: protein kinase [Deltaproteobacteria bacterium]|jgi:serine/threonine protein kinase|nr:protein kinase [Deltaproteobacteria bacterium]
MANQSPDDPDKKNDDLTPLPSPDSNRLTPRQVARTVKEGQRTPEGPARTFKDSRNPLPQAVTDSRVVGLSSFRGRKVQSFLSSSGSEADIFIIIQGPGDFQILRLFRQGRVPKPEIFQRLVKMSQDMNGLAVRTLEAGFDEEANRWYEIQEYLPGGDLSTLIGRGPLDQDSLTALISELAEALARLHGQDIIHRDIKPENILIRSLKPLKIALADFGISSLLAPDLSIKETRLANTPLYSAPESFGSIVGKAADWWSLGIIILEAVTGRHPLEGLSFNEVMREITTRGIRVPETLPDDVSLLTKGLLTRDDKKRWRYHEVLGWLMGQRDIPVYYEMAETSGPQNLPYTLDGQEFNTPEELAALFAGSEEMWEKGREHLARGYIRQWLEKQEKFDQAIHTELRGSTSPDATLFNFIQAFCPQAGHVYRGQILNVNNIAYFAANQKNLTPGTRRVLKEVLDGQLKVLVTVAESHQRPFDEATAALLSYGQPVGTETLTSALAAVRNQNAFIWGRTQPAKSSEAVKFALQAGVPLIEKAYWQANVPQKAVLPRDLFSGGLNEAMTYRLGAERLFRLVRERIFNSLNLKRYEKAEFPQIGQVKVSPLTADEMVRYGQWRSLSPAARELENFAPQAAVDELENRTVRGRLLRLINPYFILTSLIILTLLAVPTVWLLDGLNIIQLDSYGLSADLIVRYRIHQKTVYNITGLIVAALALVFIFYRRRNLLLIFIFAAAGGFALYKYKINPKNYTHLLTWFVHGGFFILCVFLINSLRKFLRRPGRLNA